MQLETTLSAITNKHIWEVSIYFMLLQPFLYWTNP